MWFSLVRWLVDNTKQLLKFLWLNREGSICFLWGCETSTVFPAGQRKCCSQCFKTVSNICTGSNLIVSENFLCPIAINDSQKPLKLRAARPELHAGWRRLMLMNIMSNAARVKPNSVRWHRLWIKTMIIWNTVLSWKVWRRNVYIPLSHSCYTSYGIHAFKHKTALIFF